MADTERAKPPERAAAFAKSLTAEWRDAGCGSFVITVHFQSGDNWFIWDHNDEQDFTLITYTKCKSRHGDGRTHIHRGMIELTILCLIEEHWKEISGANKDGE